MTNHDGNLVLLPPCMFTNGRNSTDINRSTQDPPSSVWRSGETINFPSDKINVTIPRLAWINEQSIEADANPYVADSDSHDAGTPCWSEGVLLEYSSPWADKVQGSAVSRRPRKTRVSAGSSYKHVPHRDKPPVLVARRNARERRRVQAVNTAFSRLRKVVPLENNRGKRVSKVKTLHKAIEYISQLQDLLMRGDSAHTLGCRNPGNHPDGLAELLDDFEGSF
ncbi:uncharacterized protein [Periplaneta americana]|uniref:uncharacterized protein n=1 Tax=Periplaneta americana TaxID=6978 RepID=UPI0037E7089A